MAESRPPAEPVRRGTCVTVDSIRDVYIIDAEKLGEGAYGSVCRGTHRVTGDERAIKRISKTHPIDELREETAIMKMMDHPNIIRLFDTYQNSHFIYLVMELCTGGDLFGRMMEVDHFSEREAAAVMQQVFRAVAYMHQQRPKVVCHRDLKPENFLFATREESISESVLKLIDFGLSTSFEPGKKMKGRTGTPYYMAPEILAGSYDERCDLWSAGVIMYRLLSGEMPFQGENIREVFVKVNEGRFDFPTGRWQHISDDAKCLVSELLMFRPQSRCTAQQALNHGWIKHNAPDAKGKQLTRVVVKKLSSFQGHGSFKKAVLQIIVGQLNGDEIKELWETFMAMDVNGDGLLTLGEVKTGLRRAGLGTLPGDLLQIVDGIDADGSGEIDYTESFAAAVDRGAVMREGLCWKALNALDLDLGGGRRLEMAENFAQCRDFCTEQKCIVPVHRRCCLYRCLTAACTSLGGVAPDLPGHLSSSAK
jgi:calcium-dependent protein kinase